LEDEYQVCARAVWAEAMLLMMQVFIRQQFSRNHKQADASPVVTELGIALLEELYKRTVAPF